jgi:hypothetical protein
VIPFYYGAGSGPVPPRQKVTVPTVPVPVPQQLEVRLHHEGNAEEENNGYVVLKKYPRISLEKGSA